MPEIVDDGITGFVCSDEADLVATLRWGYEWDIGAAALIAREAGAAASRFAMTRPPQLIPTIEWPSISS